MTAPTPPDLPTVKAYPITGEGGRFNFFFTKIRKPDEPRVTILPFNAVHFLTPNKNCLGVVITLLRRTRIKD